MSVTTEPSRYDQVIQVQPTVAEVRDATTLLTHLVAAKKLLPDQEHATVDNAIQVSRRAIGYYSSYGEEGKKIINDMRDFLILLLQTPKYKQTLSSKDEKNKILQEAGKIFIQEFDDKFKKIKSAPITIPQQKLKSNDPRGSFSPHSSEGFHFVVMSPPPRKNIPLTEQQYGSPYPASTMFSIFMQPAIPWQMPIVLSTTPD
jgi:hypothetical protein